MNSENKECNAMLPKYCSSKLAASVPDLKSQMFFKDILHLISSRSVCKSLILLLSPKFQTEALDHPGFMTAQFLLVQTLSKVISRDFFQTNQVCCVLPLRAEKLVINLNFRKESWPTSYEWSHLIFDYWFSFFLFFIRLPVFLQVFCTVNLIACFQFFLCNLY